MRRHIQQPPISGGYVLNPPRGFWSVMIPTEQTNYASNPSAEANIDNWTVGGVGITLTQSSAHAYDGLYSMKAAGTPGLISAIYQESPVATGQYSFSAAVYALVDTIIGLNVSGVDFDAGGIEVAILGGVWTVIEFPSVINVPTSLNIVSANFYTPPGTPADQFYVDAVQLEGGADISPFFSGSTPGCYWIGLTDRSQSVRTLEANSGPVVNFDAFGLMIDQYSGAGMPNLDAQRTDFAILDGATYEGTRVTDRTIALGGRFSGASHQIVQQQRAALIDAINRDRTSIDVPCVLRYQAFNCDTPGGVILQCEAVYVGGLEGNVDNLYNEQVIIQFRADDPFFYEAVASTHILEGNQTFVTTRIARYNERQQWSAMGGGPDNNAVRAILRAADGYLYVGGSFTSVNGIPNTRYLARWREDTGWESIGAFALGTLTEKGVHSLAVAANGDLYVGGDFANVDALANTLRLAKYTPSTGLFSSFVTTGADSYVRAMAIDGTGLVYFGGDFLTIGGTLCSYIAKYDGSSVLVVKPAGLGANNAVYALAIDTDNTVYAGGAFSSVDGVSASRIVSWNGTAWAALGAGVTVAANAGTLAVYALQLAPGGLLYAGGNFTLAGGVTVNHVAAWTGTSWQPLGAGVISTSLAPVRALAMHNSLLYVAGAFSSVGTNTFLFEGLALWNGFVWLRPDVNLPGALTITAIYAERAGVTFGYDTSGNTVTSVTTAITTTATAANRPVMTIKNALTVVQRLYQIINTTSGDHVYFDMMVLAGEIVTIDFYRRRISSNVRGDITYTIIAGSNFAGFRLLPRRINYVNVFIGGAANRAVMRLNNAHWSVDGGVLR